MKIFKEGFTENGYGPKGIVLPAIMGKIFSIHKNSKGDSFRITEECDGYFFKDYTKEEMLQIIEDLKEYVNYENNNTNSNL